MRSRTLRGRGGDEREGTRCGAGHPEGGEALRRTGRDAEPGTQRGACGPRHQCAEQYCISAKSATPAMNVAQPMNDLTAAHSLALFSWCALKSQVQQ